MTMTVMGNRHRAAHVLVKAGITTRGQLGSFDVLLGIYGIGPVLSKQLARDLETLNPMQWCEAYPRIEATQQIVRTTHYNEQIEGMY